MSAYLYEEIDSIRKGAPEKFEDLPCYVQNNLTHKFKIRPYQQKALENFIFYLNNTNYAIMPSHVLFHMATGSGKTYIMAALMLYLFKQGLS